MISQEKARLRPVRGYKSQLSLSSDRSLAKALNPARKQVRPFLFGNFMQDSGVTGMIHYVWTRLEFRREYLLCCLKTRMVLRIVQLANLLKNPLLVRPTVISRPRNPHKAEGISTINPPVNLNHQCPSVSLTTGSPRALRTDLRACALRARRTLHQTQKLG